MFIINNQREVIGHFTSTFGTQVKALMISLECQACMFFFTFCHHRGRFTCYHVIHQESHNEHSCPQHSALLLCVATVTKQSPFVVLHLFFDVRSSVLVELLCCSSAAPAGQQQHCRLQSSQLPGQHHPILAGRNKSIIKQGVMVTK